MTSERRASKICSGRRPAHASCWIIAWLRGLAAMRAPQMCRCSGVLRSFEPNSELASAEGRLCHAVLCETGEEPFKRLLPDLVENLCSPLFLQGSGAPEPAGRG